MYFTLEGLLTAHTKSPDTYTRIENPRVLFYLRLAWWLVVGLNIVLVVVGLYHKIDISESQFSQIAPYVQDPEHYRESFQVLFTLPYVLINVLAILMGLGIFLRRSNNRAALMLSLVMIAGAANFSPLSLELARTSSFWKLPGALSWMIAFVGGYLFFFTFPNGHFYPQVVRWSIIPAVIWESYRCYTYLTQESAPASLFLVTIAFWGLGIILQWLRYRYQSSQIERQQTKWIVLGSAIAIFTAFFAMGSIQILHRILSDGALVYSAAALTNVSFAAIGVFILAVAFAITQRGLWDIDLAINRSLVYGAVTLLLGAAFLVSAYLLYRVFGQSNSGLAFAVSAVGAGVLFNPTRLRVQHLIDRQFYKFRFDLIELERGQEKPHIENPGFLTGQTLDGYELLGVIGKGGMGEVYKGFGKGKTIACKVLPPMMTLEHHFIQRFLREADTTTQLEHPNIVKMYGSGKRDRLYYMMMEFIDGKELKDHLRERGRLSLADLCDFLPGLAAALDYAHARGFVHRDIKPSNVMLCLNPDQETYRAILMDFGVAKIQDAQTTLTGTDAVGTIDYMSPEQIQSARTVDHRADIYALGIILYETLTGERPFKGSSAQVLFAHIQQPAPDPRKIVPEIPAHVAHAIVRAMAKDPDDRHQSAGELVEALRV
jgi:predicted Ser/Thr protein kinase